MTTDLHVGDIGTVLSVTVTDDLTGNVVDVSGATVLALLLRKPHNLTTVQKTPVFETDGTDGKVKYATVAGDLDKAGWWAAQVFVTLPDGSWYSSVEPFHVLPNVAVATTS